MHLRVDARSRGWTLLHASSGLDVPDFFLTKPKNATPALFFFHFRFAEINAAGRRMGIAWPIKGEKNDLQNATNREATSGPTDPSGHGDGLPAPAQRGG